MFYIFDCEHKIIGNPKGYKTHKGAERQCENSGSKIKAQIWNKFYTPKNVGTGKTRVYSIMNEGIAKERGLKND